MELLRRTGDCCNRDASEMELQKRLLLAAIAAALELHFHVGHALVAGRGRPGAPKAGAAQARTQIGFYFRRVGSPGGRTLAHIDISSRALSSSQQFGIPTAVASKLRYRAADRIPIHCNYTRRPAVARK